jgi:hypothetical protein
MAFLSNELIFWAGLRVLGLVLAIAALPVTIVLRLGDNRNATAFVGVSLY